MTWKSFLRITSLDSLCVDVRIKFSYKQMICFFYSSNILFSLKIGVDFIV